MMRPIDTIALDEIRAARARLGDTVVRTPLVRLDLEDAPAEIFLKLETLQPIGSFKLRGAGNAMLLARENRQLTAVWTASAGNMGQGVAWFARRLDVPCTVVVPTHAPETKLAALSRLGSRIVKIPWDEWVQVFVTHTYDGMEGLFIHPVSDRGVIAGNGTIGLEILEDLPDVEAVIVPFGGGGLSGGIASAIRALKPETKVYGSEVETATPLSAAFAAGKPTTVVRTPSFVDGIGAPVVLQEMWPLVQAVLDGSLVVSLAETAAAIRLLAERMRVIAEGAGASSVAAALSGRPKGRKAVCVVSGGNIDVGTLVRILQGDVP